MGQGRHIQCLILFLLLGFSPSLAFADQDWESATRRYSELARQAPSTQWRLKEEAPILARCQACGPIYSLTNAVNRALEKLAQQEGKELKGKVEILDRLNSTVLYSMQGNDACSHGLLIQHGIDDEQMDLTFATNIEMADIQAMHFKDPKQNVSFFRAQQNGQALIIRFDQRTNGQAEVRFYRIKGFELPDLNQSIPPISTQNLQAAFIETKEEKKHSLSGPRMKWRRNGLPERLVVFDYRGEGSYENYRWTQSATYSNSGFYGEFFLKNESGQDVMRLRSKGSADSTEIEWPRTFYNGNGVALAEAQVVVKTDSIAARVQPAQGTSSYGVSVAQSGDRSMDYRRSLQGGSSLTLRLQQQKGQASDPQTYTNSVWLEYQKPI